MLPITRHRTLAIPHRLALVAAAVCLVLSFTVDQSTSDEAVHAPGGLTVKASPAEPPELEAPKPREQAGSSDDRSAGRLRLFPWFSGLSH